MDKPSYNARHVVRHRIPQKQSCVYILTCREFKNLYKVGKANDISVRVKYLQIALPYEVIVEYAIPTSFATNIEAQIHRLLKPFHVKGEWYEIDRKMLDRIKSTVWTFDPDRSSKRKRLVDE